MNMKKLTWFIALTLFVFFSSNFLLRASITNTLPSAVITYPHSNAYYQVGSNVTINVYSTDIGGSLENGTVEKVEFFIDDNLVNETTEHKNHTYTFVWPNVQEGEYRITARATDNLGDTFTSAGVLLKVGQDSVVKKGISAGKGKYLANIISSSVRSDYLTYWNGVTAENAHKWGSVEGTRNTMRWGGGDNIYNFALNNNLMFRYHAIAWGSQYPQWLETLTPEEFQAEIEEYMAAMAERYPYMDQIDVLNENMYINTWNKQEHAAGTPYFRAGLGGPGETGYDWAIWLFEKARHYFPNSKLIMNDFELETNANGIREMLDVVKVLRDRGLIDGFGTQAHAFNVDGMWNQTTLLKQRIDLMASGGVPVYVTELDMKGTPVSEANQLRAYQNVFPVFWEHPAVGGITLWGYVDGAIWQTDAGLIKTNGTKKTALVWLEEYMNSRPDVGYPFQGVEAVVDDNLIANGEFDSGTASWDIQNNSGASGTMEVVTDAGMSGTKALKVCPEVPGTAHWHVQLRQPTPISKGKKYSFSFMAKADEDRELSVAIQEDGNSYTTHIEELINLTTEPKEFSFEFDSSVDDNLATMKFYIGNNPVCVYIDKVMMLNLGDVPTVSAGMNKTKPIEVYPNPFNDFITIGSYSSIEKGRYQLVNVYGQVMREGNFNNQKIIETDNLTNGLYILRIESGAKTEAVKLIKK
jgi:GH35 family endo-1,4-beta-xylanase